jgi:hypothetical protein
MEWILGNSFVAIVFAFFGQSPSPNRDTNSKKEYTNPTNALLSIIGSYTFTFALTLTPSVNAQGAFTASATTPAELAAGQAEFNASIGTCCFLLRIGNVSYPNELPCSLFLYIQRSHDFHFHDLLASHQYPVFHDLSPARLVQRAACLCGLGSGQGTYGSISKPTSGKFVLHLHHSRIFADKLATKG